MCTNRPLVTNALSPCSTATQEARIAQEKRVQQVEARQAEVERQLGTLAGQLEQLQEEQMAALEELRQSMQGTLSEASGGWWACGCGGSGGMMRWGIGQLRWRS